MLQLRRPSDAARADALIAAGSASLHAPIRARVAADEETIGWGIKRFERARLALRRLEPYALPGTDVVWDHSLATGTRFVVLARRMGLWTAGAVEITRIEDEERRLLIEVRTLEGHPVRGEERFIVERHPNGIVRFRIEATSRPAAWWSVAITPLVRLLQRRFRQRAIAHVRDVTGSHRASVAR